MSIVEFEGQLCHETPPSESARYFCDHLKALIKSNFEGKSLKIRRTLVGCNRSAEVFPLASRPVEPVSLSDLVASAPLAREGDRIGCNSCLTTLIFDRH